MTQRSIGLSAGAEFARWCARVFTASLLLQTPAWGHSGDEIKEYGTATLDGVISPLEYQCLGPNQFTAGTITYTFRFCHTNDENNDYYAFQVDDLTDSPFDAFFILFDNEHDGDVAESSSLACPAGEPLEDAIGYFSGNPLDLVYCRVGASVLIPGSSPDFVDNVAGARIFTPGVGATIELSHPLDSGDSDDYSLSIPDEVGFCVYYQDADNPNSGLGTPSVTFPINCWQGTTTGSTQYYGDIFKISQLQGMIEKLRKLAQGWVAVRFPDFPEPPCLQCPYTWLTHLSRTQALVAQATALPVDSRLRRIQLRGAEREIGLFRRAVLRRSGEIDRALGREGAAEEMLASIDRILGDLQAIIEPSPPGEIPEGVPGEGRDARGPLPGAG